MESVARDLSISVSTLERWRADALSMPVRERAWTAAARFEAVLASAMLDEANKSAWCREYGIYPQQLEQWRQSATQALAGAGSLRGYYSTGMLLFRPDETRTTRQLIYELRNGAGIPQKHIDKIGGEWREVDANERLVMKDYGERLDAERRRKCDAILQILFEEGGNGRCYTANQFAEAFEGKAGLGGARTIRDRISALATQGYIKHFRNWADYGLPACGSSKYGYLCVEGMLLRIPLAMSTWPQASCPQPPETLMRPPQALRSLPSPPTTRPATRTPSS
ncbi:hypothetical protein AGMMS49545_11560 [Betaproteobacteria bacterium]|nr:hypothetical protein AGMMS49545_11560 [Betaproteobacteria bacterium]GHU42401.1 hypothetical protein AGMMS50289_07050 [Betaproteobacteria bacterium]